MLLDLCFWCRIPEYFKVTVLLSKTSTMLQASKPQPKAHTGLSSCSCPRLKHPKNPCKEHEPNPDLTCMPSRRELWITRSTSFRPPQIPHASLCVNILKILSLPLFFPQKEDTKPTASSSAHSKQAVRWLRGRIISRGELGVLKRAFTYAASKISFQRVAWGFWPLYLCVLEDDVSCY